MSEKATEPDIELRCANVAEVPGAGETYVVEWLLLGENT
jgi:hypothetical protein